MLPNVILNHVFGRFLTLKETVSISMTSREGYTYVYDNADSGGPWKNLAQHDQTSVLLQPFKDESVVGCRFWRYEFLKRHLRFLSELRRCHRKRGRGFWNGEHASFWNTLPEMARQLLQQCRVQQIGIEDIRKPYGGASISFEETNGVSGMHACHWLARYEPYARATFSCTYNSERFAMDFSDCAYLGLRYEDRDHYDERMTVEDEFQHSMDRLQRQIKWTKRKTSNGKRRRRRKVKKGRKEFKLLKEESRSVWEKLHDLEEPLPLIIRPEREKPKLLGNKNPWPKRRKKKRKKGTHVKNIGPPFPDSNTAARQTGLKLKLEHASTI